METTDHPDDTDGTGTTRAFANRTLGRSGIEVSPLGFGCWAIGGEWGAPDGQPLGWGGVDDDESVRAVRRSPRTVPIPGFRSVAQAGENADAIAKGPLTAGRLAEIGQLLGR